MKTRHKVQRYVVMALACIVGSAHGLDADGDGMSDVWEGLYPAASDPSVDLDGDGVSNLKESQAWTDPGDSNSVFRIEAFSNGVSTLSFEWDATAWQRYQIRSGTDLQEWLRSGTEQTGTGGPKTFSGATAAAREFYLVQGLAALNSDTDALSNLEEERLGTNPELWDTDGDKVADDLEFLHGSDPLATTDSDADGLPDDWERWIIHAVAQDDDPSNDSITALADVLPGDDFDGDGVVNSTEYALGTSPVTARRNIIFYLSEDQSYHLGCFGTVGLDTPHLDGLGTGGVMFDRAFSLSSVCSPSKMAMYTGTYPHMNSAHRNVSNYGTEFPLVGDPSDLGLGGVHEDLPTLIEILRDRGYFTAVCHKSHVQPIRKFPYHEGYDQPSTPAIAAGFVADALSQAGDRPLFFLFGIGAPHLPFRNLPNANGYWSSTEGLTGDGHVTNVDANSIEIPSCYPDVPGVRQDIADYYGSIECVDAVYGGVINGLGSETNNTLILFTGDHGIGLHRAKQSIYGAGMHVPFLFGGAGVTNGVRTSEPVSHLDIVPTLLEFGGITAMPLMHGKSLWPILSGDASDISERETILTAVHRYMDSRAVCDGRYYCIRNIRKVQGTTLDPLVNIANALNTDQWQGGSPWYNRTFEATRAAAGSPQRELLRQLVEGDVPDEELYDMDNDLWMTNNLAADPAMGDVLDRLRPELARWRMQTEDYNYDPSEMTRRAQRFAPLPVPGLWIDSFNGKSGALNSDTNWTTRLFGNEGADFLLGSDRVDAPPGPLCLATHDLAASASGQDWSMSLDTGFFGAGVVGAAVCAYQDDANYYSLQLQDLNSLDTGAWVVRFVRRSGGTDTTLWQVSTTGNSDADAVFVLNQMYRMEVDYAADSSTFTLRVLDALSPGTPLYSQVLSDSTFSGGGFGILTKSSTTSAFDNFSVQVFD